MYSIYEDALRAHIQNTLEDYVRQRYSSHYGVTRVLAQNWDTIMDKIYKSDVPIQRVIIST